VTPAGPGIVERGLVLRALQAVLRQGEGHSAQWRGGRAAPDRLGVHQDEMIVLRILGKPVQATTRRRPRENAGMQGRAGEGG